MANIVEYASKLVREGKEVLVVTSGAVGVGRQRLRKQSLLRQSLSDVISQTGFVPCLESCRARNNI